MPAYVFGSSWSYNDYLQARAFHDETKASVTSAASSIVASNEEVSRHLSAANAQLGSLDSRLEELNSTFQWGFSELLVAVSGVRDTLRELVKIAKTPAQTWAYEQFEVARDAFRRELYEEALESLERAIHGFGSNTGYGLEYRFHYLRGTLHLGSFRNHSTSVDDLRAAEQDFLRAARYAQHDVPLEAGRALLAAGWAAYCLGKPEVALEHTAASRTLHPTLVEATYQQAKILLHLDETEQGLALLRQAVLLDRGYSLKALDDGDFQRHSEALSRLLEGLRREAAESANRAWSAVKGLAWISDLRLGEYSAKDFQRGSDLTWAESRASEDIRRAESQNTYFDYLDAYAACEHSRGWLADLGSRFLNSVESELSNRIAAINERRAKIRFSRPARPSSGFVLGLLAGHILLILLLIGGIHQLNTLGDAGDVGGCALILMPIVVSFLAIGGRFIFLHQEYGRRLHDLGREREKLVLEHKALSAEVKQLAELFERLRKSTATH